MPASCPVCNQNLEPPEQYLGKNWRCPACRTGVVVSASGGVRLWGSEETAFVPEGSGGGRSLRLPEGIALLGGSLASVGLILPLVQGGAGGSAGPGTLAVLTAVGITGVLMVALSKWLLPGRYHFPVAYLLVGLFLLMVGALDFPRLSGAEETIGGPVGRLLLVLAGLALLVGWHVSERAAAE